jgi:hypothetical protein
VVFFDISFIEATPRYDKKDTYTIAIELTDFSVYYTQGAMEAAIWNSPQRRIPTPRQAATPWL